MRKDKIDSFRDFFGNVLLILFALLLTGGDAFGSYAEVTSKRVMLGASGAESPDLFLF